MFVVGSIQYRLLQAIRLNRSQPSNKYCEYKKKHASNLVLLGGGLGKLQGGVKEEEYFSSINQGLVSKIREHIESAKKADYLQNWDEFQKTLDHACVSSSGCANKHKNCKEEAFFMNETAECIKVMANRVKAKEGKEAAANPAVVSEDDPDLEEKRN